MSETLPLSVVVVVEELADGSARVAPLSARDWLTHGRRDEALDELRRFLEEELAEASPALVARLTAHSLPDRHAIRVVGVPLPLTEQEPERTERVDVACVVLGAAASELARASSAPRGSSAPARDPEDLWIAVPAIDHVLCVREGLALDEDALDAAIAADVARVVTATASTASDLLAATPPQRTALEPLIVEVKRPERLGAGEGKSSQHEAERQRRAEKRLLLERLGRRVAACPAPHLRERAIDDLSALLRGDARLPVLVRGPELAGKSAVIEHVLGALDRPAYAISVARFLASDGGFGDWQARVDECFRAADLLDAVLYLDDLGSLALERPGSPIDLGAAMAPFLENRRVRFVGELRDAELDRFESRHRRLSGALLRLRIDALGERETAEVLRRSLGAPSADRRRLSADAIDAFVPMVARYLPTRALPGEALVTASALVDGLPAVRDEHGALPPIERGELLAALAERVGVPAALVRDELPLPPDEIAAALGRRVIGQDEAVSLVAGTLAVVKAGLPPAGKPIATFLFVGPTGTGKTELARSLAAYLFGDESALARFDMSEFMDPWAADRLIRGTDREDGLLTRRVRERPFSVLLLDEIEKAHPAVFDLLLQLLGEGRLSDARGRTASFVSTLVVMTSNLGARSDRPMVGFGSDDGGGEAEARRRERYLRAVREHFRPELLNRIDRVVPFRALTEPEALSISRLFVRGMERRPGLFDARRTLDVDDDALASVTRAAMDGGGARALRRNLEDSLATGVARLLAAGVEPGETVRVRMPGAEPAGLRHGELALSVPPRRSRKASVERSDFDRLTALRRRSGRLATLRAVEAARSEAARLVAEVARAVRPEDARTREWNERRLGTLRRHLETLDHGASAIELLEEQALVDLLDGRPVARALERAEATVTATDLEVWALLRSWGDEETEERTVVVTGDSPRALELFLLPWLEHAQAIGVYHSVHLPGDTFRALPRAYATHWPTTSAFTPPFTGAEALEALRGSPRLAQVRWGAHAACLHLESEGLAAHVLHRALQGLVRFVLDGRHHDLLFATPTHHPSDAEAKLPEIVSVPPSPTLTIDLDRGEARLAGADVPIPLDVPGAEDAPRAHGRWALAMPRIAIAALVRDEGL